MMVKNPKTILKWAAVLQIVALAPIAANASEKSAIIECFSISGGSNLATVPVGIAGKRYLFFVDTGANLTVCDKSLQPLLGNPAARTRVETANGRMKSFIYRSSGMSIGSIPMREGSRLLVADLSLMRQADDADIRGIVGMDFLSAHVICFDFDRHELRFLTSADGATGDALALVFKGGLPTIKATVPDVGGVEFLIDTGQGGLSAGVLSKPIFNNLAKQGVLLQRGASMFGTVNGRIESRSGSLRRLCVGRFEHKELLFDEAKDYSSLGLDYLSRYMVTFDFPRSRAFLAPSRAFNKRDLRDMSGLHLLRIDGRATVHSVDSGSPADRAGIRAGDTILKVDALDASRTRLDAIRRRLCAEGASIALTVQRERAVVIVIKLGDWRDAHTESQEVKR